MLLKLVSMLINSCVNDQRKLIDNLENNHPKSKRRWMSLFFGKAHILNIISLKKRGQSKFGDSRRDSILLSEDEH